MKKKNIIKKNRDYNRIIKNCKPIRYKYLSFYVERIPEKNYFFGFSIGKKIGIAVKRNKIKRQLKSIISKNTYQNGFNCIIMVNSGIISKSFQEIEMDVNNSIEKLNILK
ncbi:MAG: ribonuclease P protein component [Bacilli bacterium]|nr:ribonuclease P protein component [Bacilli bacterium]MDD4282379.1 ribonuclease P protein component [Bacilli bacterium]MDD4718246.1 ribonuclease P protein component [Bacilli bacterium]